MKISERTLRISGASVIAVLMMGSAYLFSGPNFFTSSVANAGSTEELLKAYSTKDTDGDGLPDWQEALYGTDPNKAISNSFGIPDGQAAKEGKLTPNTLASQLPEDQGTSTGDILADVPGVDPAPGSITEQFSHQFLEQYMEASNGQPMDDASQQQLISKLMQQFSQEAAKSLQSSYSLVSVHTNKTATTDSYVSALEAVLTDNDPGITDNPLDLMSSYIQNDNATAGKKLTSISAAYAKMATQLKSAQVPPSLAPAHIQLVTSLEELSKATTIVANYKTDPLATMGAFSTYTSAAQGLSQGLSTVANQILLNGEPREGSTGFIVVSIARLQKS